MLNSEDLLVETYDIVISVDLPTYIGMRITHLPTKITVEDDGLYISRLQTKLLAKLEEQVKEYYSSNPDKKK